MLQLALLTSSVALLAAKVKADVVPTGPGPNDVYRVGETCKINWDLDTTGTWDSFSITLKTGANLNMVELETVVEGLDGTTGTGEYEWTCPDVTPNSKIYFYEFAQAGETTSWTTRFTIAAADGSTTEPTDTDANGIEWGTGVLASSSGSSGSGSSASASGRASASSGSSRAASASASGSSPASTAASSAASDASESASAAESATSSAAQSMVTVTSTASSQSSASMESSQSAVNAAASASPSSADNGAGRVGAGFALGFAGAALALFA